MYLSMCSLAASTVEKDLKICSSINKNTSGMNIKTLKIGLDGSTQYLCLILRSISLYTIVSLILNFIISPSN